MGWNAEMGTVSRSFDEWRSVDRDIRAFMSLTLRWAKPGYEKIWAEARSEAAVFFDPYVHYGDEHVDLFHNKINGLWPSDHEWMLRSSVVKEAVAAFEVYLEKGVDEALRRLGLELKRAPGRPSPSWEDLVKTHALLGSEVVSERVKHIRALRHMLVHQRGELRTEQMRDQFAEGQGAGPQDFDTPEPLDHACVGGQVRLKPETVLAVLDDLAAVVHAVDPRVWHIAWHARRPEREELQATLLGSQHRVRNLRVYGSAQRQHRC
ncbi:hypothetical protein [Streptosporangium canum]|uniref:hypothetical protein n=1 Tax=Streptosporangium canum TaxID=324952 RepID=UPI00341776D9